MSTRKICQWCGAKRNIDQLEFAIEKKGKYFQAGKTVELYRCKKARRKEWGHLFLYCNERNEPPSISPYHFIRR